LSEGGVTPTTSNGLTGFEYQSVWTNGIEIYTGNNSDESRMFTSCGGRLYFRAQDASSNHELWKMESVNDTPTKVSDMEGDSKPYALTAVSDALYFVTTTTKILYKYNPSPISGFENVESAQSLSVYAKDNSLNINSSSVISSVMIFDATGKCVLNQNVSNNVVNISKLSSGLYIVLAKDANNITSTAKFVK